MKNLNQYKSCKKSELILMISILKTLQFLNSKVGEFLYSFLMIVGLPTLLFGINPFVLGITMTAHILYMLLLSNRLRTSEDKKEFHDELDVQVVAFKSFLKEKK
jgi:hypothetical protein